MKTPKVTVVIPIYNVEKYLDRCVESIVNQTYRNIEILLIDDGSLDHCPIMCDVWSKKDVRIRVIHKVNAGLGMARNTGIENATGEYICFFDSDDFVHLTIIEKCVKSALEYDSDAVIFGYANTFENGITKNVKMKISQTFFSKEEINKILLPGMYTYDMGFGISVWGKFFKLTSLTQNNIRFHSEREIISEDAYFALEYYPKITKISIVNESLYFYYTRNDSLSRIYKKGRQYKNDEFIQLSLAYIEHEKLSDCIRDHVIARYHMYTVATIKQLVLADITRLEQKNELNQILKDRILHSTIKLNILKLHKISVRIFLFFLKMRMYLICKILILIRK